MSPGVALLALSGASAGAAARCAAYGPAVTAAAPPALAVSESSGLAVSRVRPGVLYTHDDSGGAAVLYALRDTGEVLGGHPLPRGWNRDWEALAAGPCPRHWTTAELGACLYIGDLGDNQAQRPRVVVRVLKEPAAGDLVGSPLTLLETWRLTYPDGAQDAEALLVHPQTGSVDVLTKRLDGRRHLFRVPAGVQDGTDKTLQALGRLAVSAWSGDPWVTDAAWSPTGDAVVVRTYTTFGIWWVNPCAPDGWWLRPPDRVVPAPSVRQGEAVALGKAGQLFSTSEGHPMPLLVQTCLEPLAPQSCGPSTTDKGAGDAAPPAPPPAEQESAGPTAPAARGCTAMSPTPPSGRLSWVLGPLAVVFCGRRVRLRDPSSKTR